MKETIERLKELASKATPGYWEYDGDGQLRAYFPDDEQDIGGELLICTIPVDSIETDEHHDNGALIAVSRNARLAHELLERVAFLERVAEQAAEFLGIENLKGLELIVASGSWRTANFPELAHYLREREADK